MLTVTVWDSAGQPLAERLVFRQPAKSVRVVLTPDAKTYSPGGKAKVNIKTLDEKGSPTSAIVGLTVTDDSVLEMIDKREQSPRLPVMVLLESEVRELADAHVYLDPQNEKSPLAVDLLLGTQGLAAIRPGATGRNSWSSTGQRPPGAGVAGSGGGFCAGLQQLRQRWVRQRRGKGGQDSHSGSRAAELRGCSVRSRKSAAPQKNARGGAGEEMAVRERRRWSYKKRAGEGKKAALLLLATGVSRWASGAGWLGESGCGEREPRHWTQVDLRRPFCRRTFDPPTTSSSSASTPTSCGRTASRATGSTSPRRCSGTPA